MKETKMKKVAVLVSGVGSILEAMIKDKLPIDLVIADRECPAIEIAKSAGIVTEVKPRIFGYVRHFSLKPRAYSVLGEGYVTTK